MNNFLKFALGVLLGWAWLAGSVIAQTQAPETFRPLLAGAHRSPTNVVRDPYRHPAETMAFFGIQANSTVVEILPGSGGYYMEILAPWLKDKGLYIAANRDGSLPQYMPDHQKLLKRLTDEAGLYGQVQVTSFRADRHAIASAGTADAVISFRNLHNWLLDGELDASLSAFHKALKPGGILGIVDHRGRTDQTQPQQSASGYVREDVAIALIEKAGFQLQARSEVNANPLDTKDHPEGVWTLPPTYRLKDKDRAKYAAMGESDRFTLRFVKR
jgi:predicted methyltransferase